jgi:hypothetical protein
MFLRNFMMIFHKYSLFLLGGCFFGCSSPRKNSFSEEQLGYANRSNYLLIKESEGTVESLAHKVFIKAVDDELDGERAELYRAQLYVFAERVSQEQFIKLLMLEPEYIRFAVAKQFVSVVANNRNFSKIYQFLLTVVHDHEIP